MSRKGAPAFCLKASKDGRSAEVARADAKPVDCELRVQTSALADLFCQWPTLTRVDAVTLRFSAASAEHAVRMLKCLSAMSFVLS